MSLPQRELLFESPHFRVELREPIVFMRRTGAEFETVEEVVAAHAAVVEVLRPLASAGRVVMIDLRAARGRNDPEFEARIAPYRREFSELFRRSAIIVRSAVGRLQVQRLAERDGVELGAFTDEGEARHYLLED